MRVLLVPVGSSGDVDPFVGIGRVLHARGHHVTVLANEYFGPLITRAGLDFAPVGSAAEYQKAQQDPRAWDPAHAFPLLVKVMILDLLKDLYREIKSRYQPGNTVVAAATMALGARIAQDKLGVPLASVHLQPEAFRSSLQPPAGSLPAVLEHAPAFCSRLWYWALDTWMVDPLLTPGINALRSELGLPLVHRVFDRWYHSPQRVLGLFPDWFAPIQADWPAQTVLTGFPLYDERGVEPLPDDLRDYLAEGSPPVVFTFGTAMRQAGTVFAECVEVCRQVKCRGLMLTRFPEQLPAELPAGVRHFAFIPFSQVLPHVAAVVHHGGIGTTSQALAAGIPQLVVPFAYDQPDNAARVERLGVGHSLPADRFSAAPAAELLRSLMETPSVAANCKECAHRLVGLRPLEDAARAIESLAPNS